MVAVMAVPAPGATALTMIPRARPSCERVFVKPTMALFAAL